MDAQDVDLLSARSFSRQAGSTFGLQLAAAIVGGLTVLVCARTLGPADQGIAYSLVAMGTVPPALLGGGLVGAIISLCSPEARRGSLRGVAQAVVVVCVLSLGAVTLLLATGEGFGERGTVTSLGAVLVLSVLVPVDLALSGVLRSTGRVSTAALIDLAESLVVLLAVLAFAHLGDLDPIDVILSFATGLVASIVWTAGSVRRLGGADTMLRDRLVSTSSLLRMAVPLSLGAGMTLAVFRFDVVWVRALLGEAAAGVYSVAARIAEPALLLPGAVSAVVTSRSARGPQDTLRRTTPTIFWSAALSSMVPVLGLSIAAAVMVEPLFGPDYLPAVPLVLALGLSRALLGSGLILSEDMNQRGHRWMPVLVAAGLVVAGAGATPVVRGSSLGLAAGVVAGLGALFVVLSLFVYRRSTGARWSELLTAGSPARILAQGRGLRR